MSRTSTSITAPFTPSRTSRLRVNEGEIVTLIGANGAGKTTTLQTVSGLLHTRTGSIEFLGQPIQNVPASKLVGRGLAQVPRAAGSFSR